MMGFQWIQDLAMFLRYEDHMGLLIKLSASSKSRFGIG